MSQEPTKAKSPTAAKSEASDGIDPGKYYRVRFHDQGSKTDTVDVELTHNCETLIIQRGKEVVCPGRYLIVADHARYPVYKQEVGQERKIVGWVRTYPYDPLGAATEQEYIDAKRKGTKSVKDAIKAEAQPAAA